MESEKLIDILNNNAPAFKIKERRKGNDAIIKIINFVCYALWAVLVIILSTIETAGLGSLPQVIKRSMITNDFWNVKTLNIALIFTIALFFICIVCIVLSLKRTRRRSDKVKMSLFIGELLTVIIGVFIITRLY